MKLPETASLSIFRTSKTNYCSSITKNGRFLIWLQIFISKECKLQTYSQNIKMDRARIGKTFQMNWLTSRLSSSMLTTSLRWTKMTFFKKNVNSITKTAMILLWRVISKQNRKPSSSLKINSKIFWKRVDHQVRFIKTGWNTQTNFKSREPRLKFQLPSLLGTLLHIWLSKQLQMPFLPIKTLSWESSTRKRKSWGLAKRCWNRDTILKKWLITYKKLRRNRKMEEDKLPMRPQLKDQWDLSTFLEESQQKFHLLLPKLFLRVTKELFARCSSICWDKKDIKNWRTWRGTWKARAW